MPISASLKIDVANSFSAAIHNFHRGDAIDLGFHGFAAGDHVVWTPSGIGGTLSLLDNTGAVQATLNFADSRSGVRVHACQRR